MILGLETSCDETAAGLVTGDGHVHANVVASQAELHARYGGVVPEVASRRHLELVAPVVDEALARAGATLADVRAVAVTRGPGLIGALLVGLSAAKALAWSRRLPLVPVDHLHGHVAALYLEPRAPDGDAGAVGAPLPVAPPFLCLLATGGHTLLLDVRDRAGYRVVGTTLDDAAGEAFDKGARLLGLGYPGGAAIDRLAREGDPEAFRFPVARVPGFDFSFSGLKTALVYAVRELSAAELERRRADLAASYQRAIVRALLERTRAAAEALGGARIAVVGGVAANSELRAALPDAALAPLDLCTDNAAMIASAARFVQEIPYPRYLALDAYASAA
jgi:N6-L-threonylcarbamoyladenine synthase